MLLPKGLGVEATAKNKNDLKLQKAHEEKVAKENLEAAQAFGKELAAKRSGCKIKVGGAAGLSAASLQKKSQRRQRLSSDMRLIRKRCSFPVRSKNWAQRWFRSVFTLR